MCKEERERERERERGRERWKWRESKRALTGILPMFEDTSMTALHK